MISGQVPVRQMHVHDTWAVRDLPVLDATIGLLEHSYMVTVTDIAAKTAFDPSVVAQALEALDPIYVDFRKTTTGGDPRFWYVFKVTPEARRAVGQWPSAEALVSRLVDELSVAARKEGDAENQGLLVYAARLIGDTLRDVTLRAAGAVLEPAFGGVPVPEYGRQVPPPPPPRPVIEFDSLVPLPELPELLRPQRDDRGEQPAPVPPQPEPERSAPEPPAPEPAALEPPALEQYVLEPAEPETPEDDDSALEAAEPEPTGQPRSVWEAPEQPEPTQWPAATPPEPSADVPDLNPWPERPGAGDAASAALSWAPLTEPTSFRSSFGTWPAADGQAGTSGTADTAETADSADTDEDLVRLRRDAV